MKTAREVYLACKPNSGCFCGHKVENHEASTLSCGELCDCKEFKLVVK